MHDAEFLVRFPVVKRRYRDLSDKSEHTNTSQLIVYLAIGIESIATVEIGHTRRQLTAVS